MSHYFVYMSMFRNAFGYHDPIEHNESKPLRDYLHPLEQPIPPCIKHPISSYSLNFYPCTIQLSSLDPLRNHVNSQPSFNKDDDFSAMLDSLTRKVEWLELENFQNSSEVRCSVCKYSNHQTDNCPTIPALKKFFNGQPSNFQSHHKKERFSFN